jgi:hypothetical protein
MNKPDISFELLNGSGVISYSKVGLVLAESLEEKQWEKIGAKLGAFDTAYQWMVGDWWRHGEKKYGNKRALVECQDWSGPAYQTCRNCGWVAGTFEMSLRRDTLTFYHHHAIAPIQRVNPDFVSDIFAWCEEPIKDGKRPRSVPAMKREIKHRMDRHYNGLSKRQAKEQIVKDYDYTHFMGAVDRMAAVADLDMAKLARIQVEVFGWPENLQKDLDACHKAIAGIKAFLKAVQKEIDATNQRAINDGAEPNR